MYEGWTKGPDGITRGEFHGRVWEVRWRPQPKGGQQVGTAPPEIRVDGGRWFTAERSMHKTMLCAERGELTPEIVAELEAAARSGG